MVTIQFVKVNERFVRNCVESCSGFVFTRRTRELHQVDQLIGLHFSWTNSSVDRSQQECDFRRANNLNYSFENERIFIQITLNIQMLSNVEDSEC